MYSHVSSTIAAHKREQARREAEKKAAEEKAKQEAVKKNKK